MALSSLEMSRYYFLNSELSKLNYNETLENKEVIVEYITQELQDLESRKRKNIR